MSAPAADARPGVLLAYGDLTLDPCARQAARGRRELGLTRTEFNLLEMFLQHPGQVLPRRVILARVWGIDFPTSANSLDMFVHYLRRKTEAGGEPRLIQTARGIGFVLREEP